MLWHQYFTVCDVIDVWVEDYNGVTMESKLAFTASRKQETIDFSNPETLYCGWLKNRAYQV